MPDERPLHACSPELRTLVANALTEVMESTPVLDLSDLSPPEPFEHLLRAALALPPSGTLVAVLPRDPVPAKAHLVSRGFSLDVRLLEDGRALVRVRR